MTGETILIAKDNPIIAYALRASLKRAGYRSLGPVVSGEAALVSVATWRPDLILMDVGLKEVLDGIVTVGLIQAIAPQHR
jgi:CheY-like chemotaxis protein